MRPLSERTCRSFPQYRIEERAPDQVPFIVGFAQTPTKYRTVLARRAAQLTRARLWAELVAVDLDS